MPKFVDLTKKPYELNPAQITWVENTIASMDLETKFKQLFIDLTASKKEEDLKENMEKRAPGGVRYNPGSAKDIYDHNRNVQKYSSIPCFVAANCESGGNGAFNGGTLVGCETKIAATNDLHLAYELGEVSAKEASMVGVNTIFAPIVDIHHDFHNPVISNRTFGNDPEKVKAMSLEFLRGIHSQGLLAAAKHFPGDGYDERDQHLAPVTNPLSQEEWDKSFGMVYSSLIQEGLDMVMVGHISLPSYAGKDANHPELAYRPATICPELINGLLKEKLGFNGLAVTDATHMVGFTCAGKRKDLLPLAIASGMDMILFYNDYEEDLAFVREGYEKGVFDDARLNDALRRILGLKAKLGYASFDLEKNFPSFDEEKIKEVLKQDSVYTKEVAEKGITLVKDEDHLFSLTPEKYHRILLVGQEDENPFAFMMPKRGLTLAEQVKEKLEKEGFEVTIFESLMDKAKKLPPMEAFRLVGNVYNNKTPIHDLTDHYDLVIQLAHFDSHNTVQRISWKLSKGTADVPWYVFELPVLFVSFCSPFHLFDVPQVKNYINAYDKNVVTVDVLIDKLLGRGKFEGVSPVDAFCGTPNTTF